jgi:hypothetical protein
MPSIDELMAQIPIDQVAGQLGVSDAEAEQAVRAALPALVGGLQANAQDPAGAASLSRAIGQHDGTLLEGGVDLGQVDTDDGAKIVKNIFGDNEDAVVNQLGGLGGGSGGLSAGMIAKLLPMLAPLLMSFLGKSFGGGGGSSGAAPASGSASTSGMGPGAGSAPSAPAADSGGGLGDILGGLLGGGGGDGLGGLGDILGGLLGGGKR